MSLSADRLAGLRRELEADILARDRALLDDFAPDAYIGFFDRLPRLAGYRFVPPDARGFCAAIEARAGLAGLEAYHRLVMVRLVGRCGEAAEASLTAEIRSLLADHLARVVRDMGKPRKRFYVHANDMFAKDFAVCRLKLLPCGVELLDTHAGVARRTLVAGGAGQLAAGLSYFLFRVGGFRPLYEIHFDRRSIGAFNEEGYTRLYLRIAELLGRNPGIKGLMSSSWWHDPQLAEISPELAFIGKHPESAGARLFLVGSSSEATADATRLSPRRSALYKEGRYQPRVYLQVWARDDLLAWARAYRSQAPEERPLGVSEERTERQPALLP